MQEARFQAAVAALGNSQLTTIILVARPDKNAIREAARTSAEFASAGFGKSATGNKWRVYRQR